MTKHRLKKTKFSRLAAVFKILGITLSGLALLVIILLITLPRPVYKTGFKNLHELQEFAKSTNELVPMSNNNTLKPEFNTYYERFRPTFGFIMREKFKYILSLVGIIKRPVFSPGFFKTLLVSLTKEREAKGQTGGTVICKIPSTPQSKFIIFGNVQGAFHSFTRDLEKLKALGYINENLQLKQPDTYVFFMGDVISRSCYSMETLAAVMRFVQENPDRVFYLRGNHETANYWQEHTLKTELQIRASHLSKELIPLATEVNKFFDTLPEAAYLTIPEVPNAFVRISDTGRTQSEVLQETNYAQFLMKKTSGVDYLVIKEKKETEGEESPIIIKAIFRGEKKRESFQPMEGLRFLAPDMDSVAWNILSCPTYVYQRAIKFHHDAFVILEAGKTVDDWNIHLYSRDARSNNPFKVTTYNMLSGINVATQQQIERYKPKTSKKSKAKKKTGKKEQKKKRPARSFVPSEEEKPEPAKIKKPEEQPEKAKAPKEETPPTGRSAFIPPPPFAKQPSAEKPTPYTTTEKPATDKTQKTLEKIEALLLKITTTLEKMSNTEKQPQKKITPEKNMPAQAPKTKKKKIKKSRTKYTEQHANPEDVEHQPDWYMGAYPDTDKAEKDAGDQKQPAENENSSPMQAPQPLSRTVMQETLGITP